MKTTSMETKKNGRLAGFVVYGITGDGGFLL